MRPSKHVTSQATLRHTTTYLQARQGLCAATQRRGRAPGSGEGRSKGAHSGSSRPWMATWVGDRVRGSVCDLPVHLSTTCRPGQRRRPVRNRPDPIDEGDVRTERAVTDGTGSGGPESRGAAVSQAARASSSRVRDRRITYVRRTDEQVDRARVLKRIAPPSLQDTSAWLASVVAMLAEAANL